MEKTSTFRHRILQHTYRGSIGVSNPFVKYKLVASISENTVNLLNVLITTLVVLRFRVRHSTFPAHCGFCVVDGRNLIHNPEVVHKPNIRQSISVLTVDEVIFLNEFLNIC